MRSKLAFLSLLFCMTGIRQGAYAFPADALSPAVVDVRSVAMGNTASVSAVGSNAMFYNPALMTDIQNLELQAGSRYSYGNAYNETAADGEYDSRYLPVFSFTHISAAMPIQTDENLMFVPAIGYHLHLDGTRYSYLDWEHGPYELHITDTLQGGFATITPAVALKFMDKYAVGVSMSFGGLQPIKGSYVEIAVFDSLNADTSAGYYERWCYVSRSRFSSVGTFFNIGAFVEPVPQIAVSVSCRTPLNWGWRWGADTLSATLIRWTTADCWDTLSARYIIDYDDSTAFEIPAIVSLGVRSRVLPFLTLAGEFETRPYSKLRSGGDPIRIEDGFAFRAGAELVTPVIVRAGFYSEAIPEADSGSHAPKYLKGITAGLGVPIASLVRIDGCFEYAFWDAAINAQGDLYSERLFRFGAALKVFLPGGI